MSPAIGIPRPVPKRENGASLRPFLDTGAPESVSPRRRFTPFLSICWWHSPQLPSKINRYTCRLILAVTPVPPTKLSNSIGTFSAFSARAFPPRFSCSCVSPAGDVTMLHSAIRALSCVAPVPPTLHLPPLAPVFSRHTFVLSRNTQWQISEAGPTRHSSLATLFPRSLPPTTSPGTLSCRRNDTQKRQEG